MWRGYWLLAGSLTGLVGLALLSPVQADPVVAGSNPIGPSVTTSVQGTGNRYEIGVGAPVDVTYDPNAGPWIKTLLQVSPPSELPPTLIENLHVLGQAWTDWHEEITTPNWFWTTAQISVPTSQIVINGRFVDFYFQNPLPQSTVLTITKRFSLPGGQGPVQDVQINQWPTVPEPAAIILVLTGLAAAGLAYLWRRRK